MSDNILVTHADQLFVHLARYVNVSSGDIAADKAYNFVINSSRQQDVICFRVLAVDEFQRLFLNL